MLGAQQASKVYGGSDDDVALFDDDEQPPSMKRRRNPLIDSDGLNELPALPGCFGNHGCTINGLMLCVSFSMMHGCV